jgi:hypothetical protein
MTLVLVVVEQKAKKWNTCRKRNAATEDIRRLSGLRDEVL